jgi:hypothetical protein
MNPNAHTSTLSEIRKNAIAAALLIAVLTLASGAVVMAVSLFAGLFP